MKKYCALGDSVIKGIVLDKQRGRYITPEQTPTSLFAGMTGDIVDNKGRFGQTIVKANERLSKLGCDLSAYDAIFLEFGGNDCDFRWGEVADSPNKQHLPNVSPELFKEQYNRLVTQVREMGGKPVMLTLPPLVAQRFFEWVTRGIDAKAVQHWLGDVQRIYRWHETYNMAIMAVARSLSVPLIDIRSAFLQHADAPSLICDDGMHPNEKGHKLIAQELVRFAPSL